jgi:hypothetical protein
MTAFDLVSGAQFRRALKTSKARRYFKKATIEVAAGIGNRAEFSEVLAFSESAQAELMPLGEGDKVSIQDVFKVEPFVARDGQNRVSRIPFANRVLALHQPPRERNANSSLETAPLPDDRGGPNDRVPS